jgi:hypothetical protein
MAHASKKKMGAGSQGKGDGSGAMTVLAEGILAENTVLSNRDKAMHSAERGLDSRSYKPSSFTITSELGEPLVQRTTCAIARLVSTGQTTEISTRPRGCGSELTKYGSKKAVPNDATNFTGSRPSVNSKSNTQHEDTAQVADH